MSSTPPPRKTAPWWTEECGTAIQQRKRALRQFQLRPTEENLIKFKKLRSQGRQLVKAAKEKYENTRKEALQLVDTVQSELSELEELKTKCMEKVNNVEKALDEDQTSSADRERILVEVAGENNKTVSSGTELAGEDVKEEKQDTANGESITTEVEGGKNGET